MRIICENQKEYDELMEASKYIHDFTVWVKHKEKSTKVSFRDGSKYKIKTEGNWCLDFEIEMINFLAHLYNSEGVVEIVMDKEK